MVKISVIIPVYNGEKYIEECLKSILSQEYENVEILAVDDGSKDKTFEILQKMQSQYDKITIYRKENGGVSSARNFALERATGEYICFVDADDQLGPKYLDYLMTLLQEKHAEIAVIPKARRFVATQQFIDAVPTENKTAIWTGHKAAQKMLEYDIMIGPWNKLISAELIHKNQIRFCEKISGGEGFLFSVTCFLKASRVAVGNQPYYYYRIDNSSSAMTKFNYKVLDDSLEAQKLIEEQVRQNAPEIMNSAAYAQWHTYCDCFNTLVGCKKRKEFADFYKRIKPETRRRARYCFQVDVATKERVKAVLYEINPTMAAHIINHLRKRKFTTA